MNENVLAYTRAVSKVYTNGALQVPALREVSLEIHRGEFLALVGPSGSGKTTLLNLLGALDEPTEGEVSVLGSSLAEMSARGRSRFRLEKVGFVFQAYNLVPVLTAVENVEFVLELQGVSPSVARTQALKILDEVGLGELAHRRPNELSGGQQQRVAVARAVASEPPLVLADEPTANLDGESAERLMSMMGTLRDERGITFVFSTHDPRVIAHASRVITLEDGVVVGEETRESGVVTP